MNSNHSRIVGSAIPKHDAFKKVTGEAVYTDDLLIAGMVYGGLLRSPYPHARIVNIDASAAEALSGVKAVLLPKDVPQIKF